MKIKKPELIITAAREKQYPKEGVPEIALAGRSNVGKSSLINTLVNRKNLARTSGKPGKTQTINFYNIDDKFRFVDLPGYGYAKVSLKEREKWGEMIETYLTKRKSLVEVILLLDIRHKPGEHDAVMYNWIKSFGYNGIVIATKCDKLSKNKRQKQISVIQRELEIENKNLIIPFSATKKINKDKVLDLVDEIIEINK
ncbi:MAG: YihA family ribosome biogenesis GTP-binding protein [Firmicutes bacterium]|nr:YihA family ribosome biogenesis GTP-binding protein [Bacillota bacterium]